MKNVYRHAAFWCLYVIFTVAIYYVQEPNLGLHVVYELASLPAKFIAVYFTLGFILPRYLLHKKYWQGGLQFAIVLFACVLLLRAAVLLTVYPLYFPDENAEFIPDDLSKLVSPLLDLIIVSTIALVVKLLQDRERAELDRLNYEKSNVQNELQLLKSQLHPHFLFNTLNGLYAQIVDDPKAAEDMVVKLSDLLRFIIYEASKPLVRVSEDLDCVKNYIALEQERYGSRLKLQWSIAGEIGSQKVPPLLLLPFIENSFKHGISKNFKEGWITCRISLSGHILEMDLENSLMTSSQVEDHTSGIGISNVKQRLLYNFKDQFTLTTRSLEDSYRVYLKIPIVEE